MDAIFGLPPQSPLAEAFSEDWSLLPLRVPMGWNVVYNTLMARRLPDGRVEVNDSEDLYWARTARPPWLTEQEAVQKGGLQAREISIDAGWYYGCGFRIVVLDPDWDHEGASYTTSDLEEFVATLEGWMRMITERGGTPQGLRSPSRLSAGSASGTIGPAHCDGSGADSRGVVGQAVRVAERVCVREIDDDEGRRLVRILRRGTGSVVTWRRAQMILLSAQGMPVAKIAEVTFTSADRVRDVIHSFNTDGFDSLYPKYKGADRRPSPSPNAGRSRRSPSPSRPSTARRFRLGAWPSWRISW